MVLEYKLNILIMLYESILLTVYVIIILKEIAYFRTIYALDISIKI